MKPILSLMPYALCLLVFNGCQQSTEATADLAHIKAEIQTKSDEWAAALNTRDLNAIMDLYAEEAVSMPDMNRTLTGKEAIKKYQEQDLARLQEGMTYAFETLEVYAVGNSVTELGLTTVKDAEGKVSHTGKYMCVWEKQDGQYHCMREIYNGDQAPGPVADRSIHLFDMPEGLTEAELATALAEMNSVIAGLGYPNAGYYLYKSQDDEIPDHRFYFEGVWPDADAYQKIHADPTFLAAGEKLRPLYDKIKAVEIYRRMSRVQ